jgi:hypothetical protein
MSLQVLLADTPELREAIYALRYVIYVEEMGKSPPTADHQRRWIRDGLDATARLYAVQDEAGTLVGTLRLNRLSDLSDPTTELAPLPIATLLERFPPEAISHTSRLMLLPAWRGGAALGLLFNRCYGDAAEAGVRVDLCHAKPGLVELYEQLGYRRFCPGLDLKGVGYQVPMLLALHDRAHLRESRSPLLRHPASRQGEDPWGDATWMASIAESYRGLNHRLVEPDAFWGAVGDALREGEQEIPLFRGLSEEQSRALLKTGTVLSCQPGDPLVREGEQQQELFVVLEGVAEVWRGQEGHRLSLALLERGAVFGEMGFLGRSRRSADVIAVTPMRVLVLTQAFLNRSIRHQPDAAALLLRNLSMVLAERLAQTTDRLWQLSQFT